MLEKCKDKKIDNLQGTMYFYAPETCGNNNKEDHFDAYPLDIWALGITVFALTFLQLPFTSDNNNYFDLIEKISKAELKFPTERGISQELKNLIMGMLEKDPTKRITCKDLMKNEWLNKGRESLVRKNT